MNGYVKVRILRKNMVGVRKKNNGKDYAFVKQDMIGLTGVIRNAGLYPGETRRSKKTNCLSWILPGFPIHAGLTLTTSVEEAVILDVV